MASKQPFKLFDIAQKLTTWSIRISKFFKHRLLSKRKNLLLITDAKKLNGQFFALDNNKNELNKLILQQQSQNQIVQKNFEKLLVNNFLKTWEITQLRPMNINREQIQKLLAQKPNSTQQQKSSENHLSSISLQDFNKKQNIQNLQKYFSLKKKFYDAVIVLPQQTEPSTQQYPQIQNQSFATDFIDVYEKKILKNVVSYRFAHKFLTTSGTFIQSSSQYDFLKTDKKKTDEQLQKEKNLIPYAENRPPASKQIIDSTICYLGILIGDRDYTDINSWTLVSLSQEAAFKNPQYVSKMYYDWADGQQLPMPGSFTLFKRKVNQNKKQLNFVQYL